VQTELKQRVITALILLPVVIWCVFFAPSTLAFALFAGAVVTVGAWEWATITGWTQTWQRLVYASLIAALLFIVQLPLAQHWHQNLLIVSVVFWWVALRLVKGYPKSAQYWANAGLMAVIGIILLVPAWLGLTSLHAESAGWLLYLLMLVWGADTGAYFAGRKWGKHKLAPSVSPGKTIEGLVGGIVLTSLIAIGVALYRDLTGVRLAAFLGLSLLTVLASVLGDLFESMAKRQAGIKDSGTIFPGHGGALDRIDSLTAAAPLFTLGYLLAGGF
jgi:phosphatidate cytidylyltransferase